MSVPVHPEGVPTKERRADRGVRAATQHLREIGRELHEARLAADLSQAVVARAIGASAAEVGRIERAEAMWVPLGRLESIAAVVGLRLSIKLYPAGLPLRDIAQVALLERLRSKIHHSLVWRTEVPVPIVGDLRAWDASIDGRNWTAFVDAETRIRDAQALARRTALKRRDTATDRVILLVADTRSNRAVVKALGGSLLDEGADPNVVLEALRSGRDPDSSAVILL